MENGLDWAEFKEIMFCIDALSSYAPKLKKCVRELNCLDLM